MLAFVVTATPDEADVVAGILWQLGVRAVEERTIDGGLVELWTVVGDEPGAIDRAMAALAGRGTVRTVEIDDTAGSQAWREHAGPTWVDDGLVVVPAWWTGPLVPTATVVTIDPGGAFGLGDHPTTVSSLRALRRLEPSGRSVLDVGCGTGVIAVAAALLGAERVRAVDIATAAVEATTANASRHGVVVDVDTSSVSSLTGEFSIVIANILAPTLVELADDLRRLTAVDGHLVISGLLVGRCDHVIAALGPMTVVHTIELDGWAAVTLTHSRREQPLDGVAAGE
jgi:ribosomal protein L11 methyltransferase